MSFIEKFKNYFRKKSLIKIKLTRKKEFVTIQEAKKIAIVFDATHLVSFDLVKNFNKYLTEKNKEVHAVGYVNSKFLIDHYLYRKGYLFLTNQDLNWYGKPDIKILKSFLENEYDILFDLTLEDCFPLKYVSIITKAKLKAGRYVENNNYLDLMIDINTEKNLLDEIKNEVKNQKRK